MVLQVQISYRAEGDEEETKFVHLELSEFSFSD